MFFTPRKSHGKFNRRQLNCCNIFASGQAVLTPQGHFAFYHSEVEWVRISRSLAWNECSGRAMENLTTGGSSGAIFSVFGHAVLTPQAYFTFS
jgi:hypothetical protein